MAQIMFLLFSLFFSQGLAESANCNFDGGNECGYKQSSNDDFDWEIRRYSTPSGDTGPSRDVSLTGKYIYIEASGPRNSGDKAAFVSPSLTNSQCLMFYYNMYGGGIGTLNVYANEQKIFTRSGNQGQGWKKSEIEISKQGSYQVKFEAIVGKDFRSDIAIDQITFTAGSCSGGPTQPPQTPQPPQPPHPAGSCGKRYLNKNVKVVDGQTARPHSWPWQVQLRRTSGFHFCGGSLISDQWVLTAAHCVYKRVPSDLTVRLGEHNFNADEVHQVDRTVERLIVHPSYSSRNINNDVALIKLSRKVTLKPQLSPVCLPNQGSSVDEVTGTECYITGWGRTAANRPGAKVLQEARLPVISRSKCREHMGRGVTDQMLCAGFGGSSTVSGCMGDSGGPFVCRDKSTDRWYLHGAVSWGTRTCSGGENEFTVFARVAEFANWVKQYVSAVQPPQPTAPPQTRPPQTKPPQTPPPPPTNSPSVTCNFDGGNTCSFTNDKNDDFDWTVRSGSTPSGDTGPSGGVTGSYAYIEASSPRTQGQTAKLSSPAVYGRQCLKFSYHMNGLQMGTLNVYQNTGSNNKVFEKIGNHGNQWMSQEVQLDNPSRYTVIFEGVRGRGFLSDIAIDEVSIIPGKCVSGVTPRPPTQPPQPPSGKCGEKGRGLSDDPRIVGGQDANPGEWPWQVALHSGSGRPFCGASLVSDQYVITAAHCVKASDWSRLQIRVGEHILGREEGFEKDFSIAENGITVHPQYRRSTTDYDVAIIKLSKPIQHTQRIKPVCINSGIDFTGKRCYISGWGRLSSGGSSPKTLQEAQVPIVTQAECQKSYGVSRITDRMLCAGYSQGGTDTCQGDSGGPLVCEHSDGSWHLTGITSWGKGCASRGYYGVYSNVGNLYPWIKQITGL